MNWQTGEEAIQDSMDFNNPIEYTGTQKTVVNVGQYIGGRFIQTGTREDTKTITATLKNDKWFVTDGTGDSGTFHNIEQVKRRIAYMFGNGFKWKITKRN